MISIQHDQANQEAVPSPSSFDAVRKRSKRPWGGKLKDYKCFCCGSGTRLSNHHIEPREKGGSDSERNKVTLCNACHDMLEGEPWSTIVDRKEAIQAERYAQRHGRPKNPTPEADEEDWIGRTPLDKVISIRQYCFSRGVVNNSSGRSEDFRQAFRTLNSIVCELTPRETERAVSNPRVLVVSNHVQDMTQDTKRLKIDRLLHKGTQSEWVAAILDYANS